MPKTEPDTKSLLRARLHEIIFEADTRAGKLFDLVLLFSIVASIGVIMCDSVEHLHRDYGPWLKVLEWSFTVLFTIEYLLRLYAVRRPARYAASFYGVVDLLAILPTWLSIAIPAGRFFMAVRILRVSRVFRVLKLSECLGEADILIRSLLASRRKILVFMLAILSVVVILGSAMFLVEGKDHGFTSIPKSVYWAIVTMTTVGYGDISPGTTLGQAIASLIMLLGYSIIAVPTGIVTAEIVKAAREDAREPVGTQACPSCAAEGHDHDAVYCKFCGSRL